MKELRVLAIVDGTIHIVITPFEDDDFESRFDYLMEQSRREILRLIKSKNENSSVSTKSLAPS